MSWDIRVDAAPCKECEQAQSIDVGNYTSNVGPAYFAAMGFSLRDLDGVLAAVAIPALERGLEKLQRDLRKNGGDEYRRAVLGGGSWGTIEGAVEYLHKLFDACRAMPQGKIRVF